MFGQIAQNCPRFRHQPAFDRSCVGGEIEGLSSGYGMGAHQTLAYGCEGLKLFHREVGKAEKGTRVEKGMLGDQIFDFLLGLIIEGVISSAHVSKLGVPANLRNFSRRKQRIFGRDGAKRAVRMPELIAKIEKAAPVVRIHDLMGLGEVGNIGKLDGEPAILRLGDIATDRKFDLAEIAAERNLLLIRQLLVMKDQDSVAIHARFDRIDVGFGERLAEIDITDLTDKVFLKRCDPHAHLKIPLSKK